MDDKLSEIRARVTRRASNEGQLRSDMLELGKQLAEVIGTFDVFASSDDIQLQAHGPDDWTYGHLAFDRETGLQVAWRTSGQDSEDEMEGVHPDYYDHHDYYSMRSLETCPAEWLIAVAQPKSLTVFFERLFQQLDQHAATVAAAASSVAAALNAPSRGLHAALETAAQKFGHSDLVIEWRSAQASLSVEPAEAITKASSFLETVFMHILRERTIRIPSDKSIRPLLKVVTRELRLSPESQANDDLRQMCSGVIAVVQGVGGLRTHSGSAHGLEPGKERGNASHATFAVNLAGAAATFFIEAHLREDSLGRHHD